jgi:hypothetical protein
MIPMSMSESDLDNGHLKRLCSGDNRSNAGLDARVDQGKPVWLSDKIAIDMEHVCKKGQLSEIPIRSLLHLCFPSSHRPGFAQIR